MEIIARLTGDSLVKKVTENRQVVNFNVAINDSYKSGTETKKITTYIQCDYWVNPGIAPYLIKGVLVELCGRIGVNAYVNQQGEAKASLTFHVNSIKLHGGGNKTAANKEKTSAPVIAGELLEPLDDLPF